MSNDQKKETYGLNQTQKVILQNMHKTFLEALRHREQEILRFIAILAPALGGFIWLLKDIVAGGETVVFVIGTLGVLFLLLVGSLYSLTLGYNYRYLILQLAKLETTCLCVREFILNAWPRDCKSFLKKCRLLHIIPYCKPPEIIFVFWGAFIAAMCCVIAGVMFLNCRAEVKLTSEEVKIVQWFGGIFVSLALLAPVYYWWKLRNVCNEEPEEWPTCKA